MEAKKPGHVIRKEEMKRMVAELAGIKGLTDEQLREIAGGFFFDPPSPPPIAATIGLRG